MLIEMIVAILKSVNNCAILAFLIVIAYTGLGYVLHTQLKKSKEDIRDEILAEIRVKELEKHTHN